MELRLYIRISPPDYISPFMVWTSGSGSLATVLYSDRLAGDINTVVTRDKKLQEINQQIDKSSGAVKPRLERAFCLISEP
jgi:hypothetical protein